MLRGGGDQLSVASEHRGCRGSILITLWSQNRNDNFNSLPTTCDCVMKETGLPFSFGALRNGQLGISAVFGAFLAEAASHCLHLNDHVNPVVLFVTGDVCIPRSLKWCDVNEQSEGTWADLQEATEYGAYGIAIIVALALIETPRVERSAKGTGVDYWLGDGKDQRGIFQRAARLEVSGILKGDESKIAARLKEKLAQTKRSDTAGVPAYVVIVEFSRPEARFVKSKAEAQQ